MLPPLISESLTANELRWTFGVPADSPFFVGHFPGHPILPGVVALSWMMQAVARWSGGTAPETAELLNVKFQVVIRPGAELELILTPKGGGRLQVVIRSAEGVHASVLIPGQER